MTQLLPFTHRADGELLSGIRASGERADGMLAAHADSDTAHADGARPAVVLLHGAGTGTKGRLVPLLRDFAARGPDALAFDFSGHGDSSGRLGELSLRRRFDQAVSVVEEHVAAEAPLVLVGFSMSGRTLADLARHFGPGSSRSPCARRRCTPPRRGSCPSVKVTAPSARSCAARTAGATPPRRRRCAPTRAAP